MDCKIVFFFCTFAILVLAQETKQTHKESMERTKPKRESAGLGGYRFNPAFSYSNFAPSSMDNKGLSPYFLPENKIPASLDQVLQISDSNALQFHANGSPISGSAPLTSQKNYESLLFNPQFQSMELPQTYEASENPHIYQPSSIPQSYQPWGLPQTYQPSAIPQRYQTWNLQDYPSLGLPQTYQSSSQQYFRPQTKDEVKPIYEERQE